MFPTKINWRNPSQYDYIDQGLPKAFELLNNRKIKSVAFPALGCGLGGLREDRVIDIIKQHANAYSGHVEIYSSYERE
jgi:O-acetyl-ADP-ribose deacetylase (regulator of RNase III)